MPSTSSHSLLRHNFKFKFKFKPLTKKLKAGIIGLTMITPKKKKEIINEFGIHETDTGSAQVQVAVTTRRIKELVSHLKKHPKDKHSRRGLLGLVNQRRKFLNYLLSTSPRSYGNIIKKLGLKKKTI